MKIHLLGARPINNDKSDNSAMPTEQEADATARCNRLQGRNLNDAFNMVGNRPVFKTPSANVAVAIESLKRLPDTLEIQNIQEDLYAYLQAAIVPTNERAAGPSRLARLAGAASTPVDLSGLVNVAYAHPPA
jgi:hypothetical protein